MNTQEELTKLQKKYRINLDAFLETQTRLKILTEELNKKYISVSKAKERVKEIDKAIEKLHKEQSIWLETLDTVSKELEKANDDNGIEE